MGRKPSPDKNPADLKLIRIFLPPIVEAQLKDHYEQTGYEVADVIRIATEKYLAEMKERGIYKPMPGYTDEEIMNARRELLLRASNKITDGSDVGEDK